MKKSSFYISRRRFLGHSGLGLGTLLLPSSAGFAPNVLEKLMPKQDVKLFHIGIKKALVAKRPWLIGAVHQMNQYLDQFPDSKVRFHLVKKTKNNLNDRTWDAYLTSPSLWPDPFTTFIGHMPLSLSADEKLQWLSKPEVMESWASFCRPHNVFPLLLGVGPGHSGILSAKENLTEKDLFSSRFAACRELTANNIKGLGGSPVSVGVCDLKAALLNGSAEVSDAFSHRFWASLDLHQNPKFHYFSGEWLGPQVFNLLVFNDSWETLSSKDKNFLMAAVAQVRPFIQREMHEENEASLNYIRTTAANSLRANPQLQLQLTDGYLKLAGKMARKNESLAAVYDHLQNFRKS